MREEYISFSKGDLPAVERHGRKRCVVEPSAPYVPYTGDYRSLNRVKEYFMELNKSMEFTRLDTREFITDGNKVVMLGFYSARAKPTVHTYNTDFAMIWTLQNGKIVETQALDNMIAGAATFIQISCLTNQTI